MRRKFLLGLAFAIIAQVAAAFAQEPAAGALALAGSTTRIQIVRIVDGMKKEIDAKLDDFVEPRDTIVVPERFF